MVCFGGREVKAFLLGAAAFGALCFGVYAIDLSDAQRDCYRFTREVKIVQACQAANSCVFSPADLRRIDVLQESCQGLGK